ncbi:unnamed protein product [Protopolystoma xenopodis]|uniref:Uncharacterized protein n=1 Tax=Protopolystoma xenopodis TaxID=117903 RepID=A0A3S4ZY02_9PLAT|nr:unnamed protein product [Protopolystoma xenopodis]
MAAGFTSAEITALAGSRVGWSAGISEQEAQLQMDAGTSPGLSSGIPPLGFDIDGDVRHLAISEQK